MLSSSLTADFYDKLTVKAYQLRCQIDLVVQKENLQFPKRILPSVTNEIITLVKDTSLAFVIAQAEMFTIAERIASAQTSILPLMVAGLFYYIFNLIVAVVMEKVEKAYSYYR